MEKSSTLEVKIDDIITIPVLFRSVSRRIEIQEKYKAWDIADPSPRDIVEDDLWYLDKSLCDQINLKWPRGLIGHYHQAEGDNVRLFHRNYDCSYIVPLSITEFESLLNEENNP